MLTSKQLAWAGLIAAFAGILTHPALFDILPDEVALTLSGVGSILLAITRPLLQVGKDAPEKESSTE